MAIEREGYEVVNGVRVRTSNISQAPSVKKEKKVKTPPKANHKVEEPKKEEQEDEKDN